MNYSQTRIVVKRTNLLSLNIREVPACGQDLLLRPGGQLGGLGRLHEVVAAGDALVRVRPLFKDPGGGPRTGPTQGGGAGVHFFPLKGVKSCFPAFGRTQKGRGALPPEGEPGG